MQRLTRGFLLASWLMCCGCATHADRLRTVQSAYYDGELREAESLLDKNLKKHKDGDDVLFLEKSVVQLVGGHPAEAEQTLRQVRDRFDYLEQKNVAETALSAMTDDRSLAYAGEDYERVLIRGFLALANLMHGGEDAQAYCLQMIDKQGQIIQAAAEPDGKNLKASYQQVALGPYLRAMLREETHRDFDDVARYRAMVVSWAPGFSPGPADLTRAQTGHHSETGHGVLHVFTLVGRGPYKEQVDEVPSSVSLLIADRILSSLGKYTLPPTIASIKVPKVVAYKNLIQSVGVSVDGRAGGETNTLTDVSQMAVSQYDAIFPKVVARAVVRRFIKKSVVVGTKEAIGADRGSLLSLPLDLAGVAWEATERADTRCWGLLPDKIQVRRIELPVGEHEITLCPLDAGYRPIGAATARRVFIADGQSTYVLAAFPGPRLVGEILTSAE